MVSIFAEEMRRTPVLTYKENPAPCVKQKTASVISAVSRKGKITSYLDRCVSITSLQFYMWSLPFLTSRRLDCFYENIKHFP